MLFNNQNRYPLLGGLLLGLVILVSCRQKPLEFRDTTQTEPVAFAIEQIKEAVTKNPSGVKAVSTIEFRLDTILQPAETYHVLVDGEKVVVKGSDCNALLYGGLEVAEQLEMNGKVAETRHSPFVKRRGIKMNIPLDARTPSYDDTGDAAQLNIATVWEWDFWQEFLDRMALNRYNVLTLWNPHPFPSMIKMKNYPDVALNDVCVTTLKPIGKENEWGEPQMVSGNVMENLKVIKTISIEEKIAFWQKVMQYAKDRGIDIYFFNWNICANSVANPVPPFYRTYQNQPTEPPGKYGVSNRQDNPKNIPYYREAVKEFLETYPQVKGIGVTAGEHMLDVAGDFTREQWIWETYGKGIMDAAKDMPGRKVDFIHRVWNTNLDKILKYWDDFPFSFEASFKYARARLYSTPEPPFARQHVEAMKKYGIRSWWNLRNDDIFVHRWADPDYVRHFIRFMNIDDCAGFYMGSDGYVWGRVFNSKNPELDHRLEMDKHWLRFMLWGRLAFNNELPNDFFVRKIGERYAGVDAEKLFRAWQEASKIVPLVNRFHWNNWDYQWAVEACIDDRVGFHTVLRFMTNPTIQEGGLLSPEAYAKSLQAGNVGGTSPFEVAEQLQAFANAAKTGAVTLQDPGNSVELATLLDDIQSMAALGNYYATKIEAATELALFESTSETNHKEKAVALLSEAVKHWEEYAKIIDKNYRPQMLARTRLFDVNQILKEVKKDVQLARDFQAKK